MRIALAYPLGPHAPDDVIEVTDVVGRQLIRDGRARRVPDDLPADAGEPAPVQPIDDEEAG